MTSMPHPYDASEPFTASRVVEAPEIPTAVVKLDDVPMYEMSSLMDGTFSHLADALAEVGIHPIGPAVVLHHRMPVDTADLEVGFPVDSPLTETLTLPSDYEVVGSVLPGGRVAAISHMGAYGGLADTWGAFTEDIGRDGEQMTYPFWEMYVSVPSPDVDPAALRTDLFSLLEPRGERA